MNKFKIFLLCLFPFSICINFLSSKFPHITEIYYSQGINKLTVQLISNISSILPFSILEILFYCFINLALITLLSIIYNLIKYPSRFLDYFKKVFINVLCIASLIYFIFIIFWGLNYNRQPVEYTLLNTYNSNIDTEYTTNDLANLYEYLILQTNKARKNVSTNDNSIMICNSDYNDVFKRASESFDNISHIIPTDGNYGLPKPILSSNLLCYTGITGVYSPFTGEANINISNPDIYLPSTIVHEMAHQRGFANEDEANFIAYLGCINHSDSDFIYSGFVLALNHTANQLYKLDYDTYIELRSNLSEDVVNDLRNYNEFWDNYRGYVNEVSNNINNTYLKSNGVSEGVDSYGMVVDLLLIYHDINNSY